MQMHEAKQVVSVGTTKAANDRLADGWTLLAVVGAEDGVKYVFGRAEPASPDGDQGKAPAVVRY